MTQRPEIFEELFRLVFPTSPAETREEMLAAVARIRDASRKPDAGRGMSIGAATEVLLVRLGATPRWALAVILAIYRELAEHDIAEIIEDILAAMEGDDSGNGNWQDSFPADYVRPQKRSVVAPSDCTPIDPDAVSAMLDAGGALAASIPGYEPRAAQLSMAKSVAEAFDTGRHLLVEAGTGTGKSLAYLLPAALWAITNDVAVVVSTNTRNLQSQLIEKDLPIVARVVNSLQEKAGSDRRLRTALIKGRSNYLCLRRLESVMEQGIADLERPRLRQFARALTWAVQTADGDLDAFEGGAGIDSGMRFDLCAVGEECAGRSCPHFRRCFAMKARAKSLAADVVVANHALVFAEMGGPGVSLPAYSQIVFDEAHNLEEAATSHFSSELSVAQLRMLLRGIVPVRRRRAGVADSIRRHVDKGTLPWNDQEARALRAELRQLRERGEALIANSRRLFDPLGEVLPRGETQARFGAAVSTDFSSKPWTEAIAEASKLKSALSELCVEVQALATSLNDKMSEELPLLAAESSELEAIASSLGDFASGIDFVMSGSDPEHVFWIEKQRGRNAEISVCAAPLEIGKQLADALYSSKASVVFCSATLRVGDSFNFLSTRLGINLIEQERLMTCVAPSPFDYMNQCRVMVPTFLPEPVGGGGEYTTELAGLILDTSIRTGGRLLGLFTSYEMMTNCARILEGPLRDAGIRLLVQGQQGSRDQITRIFRSGGASVLLGTHSFWEGVDVVGDALSCVVIARLPFAQVGDPMVQARCEKIESEGGKPFFSFMMPSAVIKFRQGFGRLIRHRSDRGIVIVADSRVATKGYGARFRQSLPCSVFNEPDRAAMLDRITAFFECPVD